MSAAPLDVTCHKCKAAVSQPCIRSNGRTGEPHTIRHEDSRDKWLVENTPYAPLGRKARTT